MNEVVVTDLSKSFGGDPALEAVSLTIAPGEFFGLLGPSGSGKTTLLRLIAGFETADAGTIRLGGRQIDKIPVERRDIGMVFQSYALFPNLNVADNVGFGLSVRGVARGEIRRRVADALALVRLEDYGARKPHTLSGGQRQRVALARAIVTDPALLLLDEPLAALDRSLRQGMQQELRRIQRETRLTTLFVTHDQEEALTMSDRIGILRDGRLIQAGTPDALYDRPGSAFVATFLGEANLFAGTLDGSRLHLPDGTTLSAPRYEAGNDGEALLAVRPERLRVERADAPRADAPSEGGSDGHNRLRATVDTLTFSGPMQVYRLRVADRAEPLSASEPNDGRRRYEPGSAVVVSWPIEAGVLLEPEPDGTRNFG